MARVKMSSLVSQISGKSNGSQFVNTQYGLCLFNKATQRRFPRAKQLGQRQVFRFLSSLWGALTDAERASNNTNALNYPLIDFFGNTYYLTGYALLLRSNLNLTSAGLPSINVVPAIPPTPVSGGLTGYDAIYDPDGFSFLGIYFDMGSEEDESVFYVLFLSSAVSPAITNFKGALNNVAVYPAGRPQFNFFPPDVPFVYSWHPGLALFGRCVGVNRFSGIEVCNVSFKLIIS